MNQIFFLALDFFAADEEVGDCAADAEDGVDGAGGAEEAM